MALPTRDELLRAEHEKLKAQAQSLIEVIASAATSQYVVLANLLPQLQEYAEHFKEPIEFEVPVEAQLQLKQIVIASIGSAIKSKT